MKLLKIYGLIVLFALSVALPTVIHAQSKDNLGKEFFLAFGQNLGAGEENNRFALYITGPVASSGFVEVTAINFREDFTTTPGQITTILLPDGGGVSGFSVECIGSEQVLPGMSVHVVADTEVAVFGMNHKQYSTDAFMGLPIDVLGTEYRTINYQSSQVNSPGSSTPGEFLIVAINDGTNVTVTPNAQTMFNKPSKVPFTLLLNRGDVYQVQGNDADDANDLTGSLIEADLPIAVFSGHERTEIPSGAKNQGGGPGGGGTSRDHLIEQLPPVSAWGDSALVIPYSTADRPDLVRVVSSEDNNGITVNGTLVTTLNAGQFYEIKSLAVPTSIHSTNPILVGQYMHTSVYGLSNNGDPDPYGDPALALVYPVEQFAKRYTFISIVDDTAFIGNFVNVVVPATGVASMQLDGATIPATNFKTIPGSSYMYAQIPLQQGTHNITGGEPFGITVYALGNVDSYAYTGGTLLKTITPFKTADIIIDFKDKPLNQVDLSGTWDTTVSIQNISSDPLTISEYTTRSGDANNFNLNKSKKPLMISASATDSMTITFDPQKIANRRMHTTINAKTEHLRAYVVEVYGRGVVGTPISTSDSLIANKIDTIYFGVHGENSPPKDSICYVGNTGTGSLEIKSLDISGADMANFSRTSSMVGAAPQSLPFFITVEPGLPAAVGLRFTPSLPRSSRVAYLDINKGDISSKRVVLLAIVDTIEICSISSTPFDSIYLCNENDKIITVKNSNIFAVRLTDLPITGANPSDFVILDPVPIDLAPKSVTQIRVRFAPNAPGYRAATATAYFNNPLGSSQTAILEGFSRTLEPAFFAPRNNHILAGEEMQYPIYARAELAQFMSKVYTLDLQYDPTYLIDVDVATDNTLSAYCYYSVTNDNPGHSVYSFSTADGSNLIGGGAKETLPLIYVHFKSFLNGEDRTNFSQPIDINYQVNFPNSPVPSKCLIQGAAPGRITLDSTCAVVHVIKGLPDPTEVALAHPNPNPASFIEHLEVYIPMETPVKIDVIDMLGNLAMHVINETRKTGVYNVSFDLSTLPSGAYTVKLEAAGKVKLRKILVSH